MSDDKKIIFSMVGVSKQYGPSKKVLKDITREYEWRSEAEPDDYGSFHDRADWTTSSME